MKKYKVWLMRLIPIAFMLIYTIGLSEMLYQNLIRSETESCWDELAMAHGVVAEEIGTQMDANLTMLKLTSDAIMMNADIENEEAVLTYLDGVRQKTIFDRIDMLFPDGTILLQSTGKRIADNGETNYDTLVAGGVQLSRRTPDFLTGQESLHAFSSVNDANGKPIAILYATIYCSTLGDLFNSAHYGEAAQLFLVDTRDGSIVLDKLHETPSNISTMRNYAPPKEYAGDDFIADLLAGNSGTMSYPSQTYGNTSYTIYAPIEGMPFSLIMVLQEDTIFASVNELKRTMMLVGVIEVTLLVLLAVWIYFIMRRSMETEGRAQQAELKLLQKKELELESQYAAAADRQEFLETMAINLPGGYHRCTTDHNFRVTFMSNSFAQVTGYTMEQLTEEHGGSYIGVVLPEDRDYFMSLAPQLERDGFIHCAYRLRRRDGSIRWVKDTTQRVERDDEQYYQCALMDITEQIEEIECAKQEAEASSQAKSTFLFNISHDIRTPMNAIKGFSHIIGENTDNPVLVKETIAKIDQASDALMLLMNDVLDISRIERGKEEIILQPINLHEHNLVLYEMFAADMQAAGIKFELDTKINDIVYCDQLKLTRILMNMLSNAKKFTPAGGTVTYGVERLSRDETQCTYRFFVRDTGIGMRPEFLQRAFEQFERERTSTESGIIGSGLGLAIIKMLVELMGGSVELQSKPGCGTEIAAILSLAPADEAKVKTRESAVQDSSSMIGKRVLLVEDNDFNREIARYVLEGRQIVVEEAENGAVCLEMLDTAAPDYYDLILMDIQMPVMDGYAATTRIRQLADPTRARIPIVAMTANAFEEDKKKCMDVGMNGHIGKPIDIEALQQILFDILKNT